MSLVRDKFVVLVGAAGMAALLAGCPDGDDAPDARILPPDASDLPDADTTPDADVDAMPPMQTISGSISIQEVKVAGVAAAGQGIQVSINFEDEAYPGPTATSGSPPVAGCAAFEYTGADLTLLSKNAGVVTVTSGDGTPALVPCAFIPTLGYRCIDMGSSGMGMNATVLDDAQAGGMLPAGTALYAFVGATFDAADVGRYVQVSGATNAANNGAFPIVSLGAAPGSVVVVNQVAVTEQTPFTASYTTVAGAGPVPGVADPGFLEDDDILTVALTPGGDMDVDAFSLMVTGAQVMGAGDGFAISNATAALLNGIPLDGTAFTIGCTGEANCGATNAAGSILSITTTDGSTAGLSPFAMPPPVTKKLSITCGAIGQTQVTVPASISALIMNSGATRIQTTFIRPNLVSHTNTTGPAGGVNIVAGHAFVGFTNAPAP